MRGARSLLVLGVVFAGLLAYLYFVDAKRPVTPEGSEPRDKVFSVESDAIEELRVKSSSGETAALRKGADGWQLVEPIATKADASEVSGITSNLATAEIASVVDEDPADLQPYGLQDPRVEIAFKATGDKADRRLVLGAKTPTGGDIYARRGDEKRVFLVPAYMESSFDRKPFDLRDKTVLAFDRDKVDRLEIAHGTVKVELAKSGADWAIVAPVKAHADAGAVEGLITRLQSAQMKSLADEQTADVKRYGLGAPVATATVGAGSTRATLAFGKQAESGDVYARDTSRPVVVTVGQDLLNEVKKTAADFRRKDIFEFRPYNASRIEIVRGNETIAFEKTKAEGQDADKWRRVAPQPGDVDETKVESLLSALSNLRAQSFVEPGTNTGLSPPAATVSATFGDEKKQERVRFGRVGSDVFAAVGDEPGAARVDAGAFDEAMKTLDGLR